MNKGGFVMASTATNREILEDLFSGETFPTPDYEYQFRSDDFVAEIPQTGERFESREALRSMQEGMGEPPSLSLKRIVGEGDLWVVEAIQDYESDGEFHVCAVVEFKDGKIVRETRYYGPPLQTDRT
jgi:hypothetical protein